MGTSSFFQLVKRYLLCFESTLHLGLHAGSMLFSCWGTLCQLSSLLNPVFGSSHSVFALHPADRLWSTQRLPERGRHSSISLHQQLSVLQQILPAHCHFNLLILELCPSWFSFEEFRFGFILETHIYVFLKVSFNWLFKH